MLQEDFGVNSLIGMSKERVSIGTNFKSFLLGISDLNKES